MARTITLELPLEDAEHLAALAGAGLPVCSTAPAALHDLRLAIAKERRLELAGLIARRKPDALRRFLHHASPAAIEEAWDRATFGENVELIHRYELNTAEAVGYLGSSAA